MNTPLGLKIFVAAVILAVISAVGYGIYVLGTPAGQRSLRFDQLRVSHLENISHSIGQFWERNQELPAALEDLKGPQYFVQAIADPESGEPYEYRVLDENSYKLCAVFATDSKQQEVEPRRPYSATVWDHGPGRFCFDLEVRAQNGAPPPEPKR